MRQRRAAAAVCSRPVRSDGNDDAGANAEHVIKFKEAAGRGLHDAVDTHALHICRRAVRDRRVHGASHSRVCVHVQVVYSVLRHHRRKYEELARSWNYGPTADER
jgi:hypothetical protein